MKYNVKILILLIFAFPIYIGNAISQENNTKTSYFFGGNIGLTGYTISQEKIPVNPFFKLSPDVGINGIVVFRNDFFIKTGISYTYFRSPFTGGESTYDELIQVSALFPFYKPNLANNKNNLILSIGPLFSILANQSIAKNQDVFYTKSNEPFGGYLKFGIVSEIAIYTSRVKYLNSYGFRFTVDLAPLTVKNNSAIVTQKGYITGTIFMNLNRNIKNSD